jgi:hypothetical protein
MEQTTIITKSELKEILDILKEEGSLVNSVEITEYDNSGYRDLILVLQFDDKRVKYVIRG